MTETIQNHRIGPSKDCPNRYPACSDHCRNPAYIAWKEEQAKIRAARKHDQAPAWINDQPYDRRWKTAKK